MSILVAMIAPSIVAVMTNVRKTICMDNVHAIISGVNGYAQDDKHGRFPTVKPETDNWGDMEDGNPGCLALLIDAGLADRKSFLCPEARGNRGFEQMLMDANTFTYEPLSSTEGVSTLSYSFISMVYNKSWSTQSEPYGNIAAFMTLDRVPGTLPIVADQNPRCTFDESTLASFPTEDMDGRDLREELRRNSLNHKHRGQSVGRWDASVVWTTDANNPNDPEDDIYTSKYGIGSSQESQGRRMVEGAALDMSDAFLIP